MQILIANFQTLLSLLNLLILHYVRPINFAAKQFGLIQLPGKTGVMLGRLLGRQSPNNAARL